MDEIGLRWHQVRGRWQVVSHHLVIRCWAKRIIDHTVRLDRLIELRLQVVSSRLSVAIDQIVGDGIASIALVQILLVMRTRGLHSWQGPGMRLN